MTEKHIDDLIWEIFEKNQLELGFEITDKSIELSLKQLQRARARGGFKIGHLAHLAFIKNQEALTFDDITGAPYRALDSRDEAEVSTYLTNDIKLTMPLISANMECVTGYDMAVAMARMGGVGVLHQFNSDDEQSSLVRQVKDTKIEPIFASDFDSMIEKNSKKDKQYTPSLDYQGRVLVGAAIGVNEESIERAKKLVKSGVDFLVIDIAHGHSDKMIEQIKQIKLIQQIKDRFPSIQIIAGNVVTPKGAYELCVAGADTIKVGVGPGAACTTRIVTGYGIPQITAIYETSLIAKEYNKRIIADGGIRNSGDMVKALAAGADMIMLGNLLASTNRSNDFENRIKGYNSILSSLYLKISPDSEILKRLYRLGVIKPKMVKYFGSASEESKTKQKRGAYDAPEGRTRSILYTGDTYRELARFITGIKSGISYAGQSRNPEEDFEHANIKRLQDKSRWIKQTASGIYEANKGSSDPNAKL